jgi:hypothetical protein
MGGTSNPGTPHTSGVLDNGETVLGPYTQKMVTGAVNQPDPALVAAYNAKYGTQPSLASLASANAMKLINALPLQQGKFSVIPKNTEYNTLINGSMGNSMSNHGNGVPLTGQAVPPNQPSGTPRTQGQRSNTRIGSNGKVL